ncbi:MAG TPA: glucan biosynthesis protein D [Beijerinckiaceae bacterium]|nr:glucan biosynthesis protein D [Beijerinckiaceae bacterium]
MDRRSFVTGLAATGLPLSQALAQTPGLDLGPEASFSFETLVDRARRAAGGAYVEPPRPAPDVLQKIDYDAHGKIRFKTDLAVWGRAPDQRRHPVTFFHLGRYFQKPVRMHVVENGKAREIIYREDYFDMPAESPAKALPKGAGFAGFRFQEATDGALDWRKNDWVAFLGASYFRAIGELFQYGLSARGLMIDAAVSTPEEFPDFTHVWLEQPKGGDGVRAYALLDSPSAAGAFRFDMRRGKAVVMDVEKRLFVRKPVTRFGIAPLTSMYWFSEKAKGTAVDWRPEVHDSDGLALWTGSGERIWRPLNNPPRTVASSFGDTNPKGFGLLQRDRAFDHYQDGVYYEKRPSLWVEPLGGWGKGAVQLIEIPTDDEIHDNIVAAWIPDQPVKSGDQLALRYRLHWVADEPYPTPLARVVATRLGNGGQPGQPRPKGVRKFLVEFKGTPLEKLPSGVKPEAVLWASRGSYSYVFTEAVPNDVPGHWRAQFDLTAEGADPVEMRLFLRLDGQPLSETWLYQYHPF